VTDPLNGRVIAITGASSGIGEATARLLSDRGAKLVLGARRTDHLIRITAELNNSRAVPTDVTVAADLERLVGTAVDEFGRLDALVSNAGVAALGPFAAGDVDAWTSMIDVNLRGVLYGIAAAMPVFLRQGRGDFVTTVSTAGLKIVPEMGAYAATKNAVRTVLEALRQESTDGVIRTTGISPGYVRTELAENMPDFAISPDAVARAIAFALEQPDDVEIGELVIRPTAQG
jgi:NADP-dependent 3-hydroxy acid dehydrogenase YdfG